MLSGSLLHIKRTLQCLLVIFPFCATMAQEGNNWYFGRNAGLTFNTPVPTALAGGMLNTYEGCASISDKNGQLLFYTDGMTVWNRNHQPMPNGTGLYGDSSSANAAIIIPKPGSPTIYYIFTSDAQENQNVRGYNYSEVDITLDNGLGDINGNKNVLLYAPSSEKLTAVRDANGTDVWVVTHEWGSNTWRSFKVSCNGVNIPSVNSSAGMVYEETRIVNGKIMNVASSGCLKASPDGKKIATTSSNSSKWELFDFNDATGEVSNGLAFHEYSPYGVEFSPDSKMVYITSEYRGPWLSDSNSVKQFDLSIHDSSAVASSAIIVGTTQGSGNDVNSLNALQLGPDGKIYGALQEKDALSVINFPNIRGKNCNYVNSQTDLKGKRSVKGLPVFFPSLITNKNIDFSFSAGNDCATVNFSANSSINNIAQWLWDFGDGQTGTGQNVSHTYITGSEYNVQLTVVVNNSCGSGTASIAQKVNLKYIRPETAFSVDSKCNDKTVLLTDASTVATGNIVQWFWDFGDGHSSNFPWPEHTYDDFGKYDVSLITTSDGACGRKSDTLKKTIAVNARPKALMTVSNACLGRKVLFSDTSTVPYDTIASRLWIFPDGEQFTEKSFEKVFNNRNTYDIKFVVQSGAGCVSDTAHYRIVIAPAPEPQFDLSRACADSLVSFTDKSTAISADIAKWYWDLGDASISDLQHVEHQYPAPGSYTIKLAVTTSRFCTSDTLTQQVQIDETPKAAFTIANGCEGQQLIPVNSSTISAGTIKDYLWNTGAGYAITGESPALVFNTAGDHPVSMIANSSGGCPSAPATATVNIESIPEVDFVFGNTCIKEEIRFINKSHNAAGDIKTWYWDFADGGSSPAF